MTFTTRPELRGTFGMVASTHWLASAAGMAILERGGNAFDAAVAAGLTLQVVEPHLNGPGGEVPIVLYSADRDEVTVVCGQGPAPEAATLERFDALGLDLVPGTGLLAACVPGAFDAWMLLLRDFGTARLADVVQFGIDYAGGGFPLVPRIVDVIDRMEPLFREEWPSSAEIYLPPPQPGALFRNRALAETYARIVAEATAPGRDREGEIDAARDCFYRGFVAEEIDGFSEREGGLLAGADLAAFRATAEPPVSVDYAGYTVFKPGPWSQGPVMLQQLRLLEGFDLADMGGPNEADYVHTVVECAKLALADRDAWYGDPAFTDVPLDRLLSRGYAEERRGFVDSTASGDLRPGLAGRLPGRFGAELATVRGDPTRGDTCHVDVVDRHGNLVSATPSGGWLQSSPVVPGLGFPLGTRAQMFWLEEGHPNSLAPRKRPRTTLSASIAFRDGDPYLAFGTPGGDQQDQWSLNTLLAHVHFGLDLQAAIDAPMFHTEHLVGSFHPRPFEPRVVEVEGRFRGDVIADLEARGHEVRVVGDWALGRVSAVAREHGLVKAGANPRGMQGYAVGR